MTNGTLGVFFTKYANQRPTSCCTSVEHVTLDAKFKSLNVKSLPIAKLKARELDLRAMDDSVKREQDQEKINLDKSKQLMGQQQFDEKLQQNEELAQLRSDTSLEKTQMGIDSKMVNDMMKQTDVRILKGPKR